MSVLLEAEKGEWSVGREREGRKGGRKEGGKKGKKERRKEGVSAPRCVRVTIQSSAVHFFEKIPDIRVIGPSLASCARHVKSTRVHRSSMSGTNT